MRRFLKTASLAVVSLATVAVAGGSMTVPAFGAAGASVPNLLLPESVYVAATTEAQSAEQYNFLPEPSSEPVAAPILPKGAPLAQLVAAHARADTRDREEECLAAATYFEAKSESLEGQLAVAEVVLNRAKSGRFPSSVCGVVFQRGQFNFVRGGGFPPIARGSRDWREAVAVAHIAREGLKESSVNNALYFHAARVRPGWRLARVGAVGNHIFYR